MSHITKMTLEMNNFKYLDEALKKMGYTTKKGKIKEYGGGSGAEMDVVLEELPSVGFKKGEDGKFVMSSDFYNSDLTKEEFTHNLESQYTLAMATEQLRRRGVRLGRPRVVDGVMEVTGRW